MVRNLFHIRYLASVTASFLLLPLVAVSFLFLPVAASAQVRTSARVTGYFEHQYSANRTNGAWSHLDYDRFRVDINATAGRRTRASAAVVYQLYRGDTDIALADFLPDDLAALADTITFRLENRHFVNHAYFTLRPGRFDLTFGKQYLAWGAGWVFNPTELFRPKNSIEPSYDREGIGAIALRMSVATLSDLQVVLVPEGPFDKSGKILRARTHVNGFDLSALAATLYEAVTFPGSVEERRITFGGDAMGELLGAGVWAEGTWNDHAGDRWVEVTVGGNYTLVDRTFLLFEGHYNELGKTSDPYPVHRWLGRLFGSRRPLGKITLFGMVNRPVDQLWTLGLSALGNPGDGSFVLIPSVAYAFAENVDLLFNGFIYAGGDGTEFGKHRLGAFLRGRVYF